MGSVRFEALEYASSFDGTFPIKGGVCFDRRKKMPLLVLMHGYKGNWKNIYPEMVNLAQYGLFTVGAGMRGRLGSAGKKDSGGIETHDIYDCVQTCLRNYDNFIDEKNINIWGYSGGGGNVFSCVTKYPDMFRQASSFFGISDYAKFQEFSPSYAQLVQMAVGGKPENVPFRYAARRSITGAVNNPYTRIHLFWDSDEKACPGWFNLEYFKEAKSHGFKNVILHESRPSDLHRWTHGYPQNVKDLRWVAYNLLIPEIFSNTISVPQIRNKGKMKVLGHLLTKEFKIWLGDGQEGTCRLEYSFSPKTKTILISKPEPILNKKVKLWLNLSGMKPPLKVTVNEKNLRIIKKEEPSCALIDLDPESEISVFSNT